MARSKGRSRSGVVSGKRVAPRTVRYESGKTGRAGVAQCDPFSAKAKPRPGTPREKSTPSLPPGAYDQGWPSFPRDPANAGEQESILSEGEEARPPEVEAAEGGEVRSRSGRMRAARHGGTEPRDEGGGGLAFADRPLDKPIASGRPISKPPLSERNPRRKR